MKFVKLYASLILILAVSFVFSACSTTQIPGKWKALDIKVDGDVSEWENNLYYFQDDELMFGTYNDQESLYICFTTSRSDVMRQAIGLGMTCWIDPNGDKDKVVGIEFPQGMRGMRDEIMSMPPEDRMKMRDEFRNNDNSDRIKAMKNNIDKIVLVNDENDKKRTVFFKEDKEFEASFDYQDGIFSYELKIPLKYIVNDNDPFKYKLDTGKVISIGLESAAMKFERNAKEHATEGMFPGGSDGGYDPGSGGMPMGGGMRPGGMQGRGSGSRSGRPERLSFWVNVKLSSK